MRNSTFAKRLKLAREDAELTMHALERAADVCGGTVSKIETGFKQNASFATVEALCKPLDCRPEWMAFGTGERRE